MCAGNLTFEYEVRDDEVKQLKLLVPAACKKHIEGIKMDGLELQDAMPTTVFDDKYWCYDLSAGQQAGKHTLVLRTSEPLSECELGDISGTHLLEISVTNTMANKVESNHR